MARALLKGGSVLVLDEPTAGLDAASEAARTAMRDGQGLLAAYVLGVRCAVVALSTLKLR